MNAENITEIIKLAIIPAIATIISAIVSYVKEKNARNEPTKLEIMQKQLFEVYTPLMQIYYSDANLIEKRKSIFIKHRELLESDINLLHPDLLRFGKKLDTHYIDYETSYISVYNQIKHRLGYPYDKSQILYRHRFAGLEWYNVFQICWFTFFALLIIPPLLMSVFNINSEEFSSMGAFAFLLIIIICVWALYQGVTSHIIRKKSNREYKKMSTSKPNENISIKNNTEKL